MRKIWNKGHRIRASDKHLVYRFSIGTLLFVFVAVLLLLNIKQLMAYCCDCWYAIYWTYPLFLAWEGGFLTWICFVSQT